MTAVDDALAAARRVRAAIEEKLPADHTIPIGPEYQALADALDRLQPEPVVPA